MATAVTTNGPSIKTAYIPHRRRFFANIAKWFYTDAVYEEGPKLDAADLVILLQTLGFNLLRFDKVTNAPKSNDLRVEISCGISDLQAVLILPNNTCKCPNAAVTNQSEFWTVTGSAPPSRRNSMTHINEAGSSLLPPISKGTCSVARDVLSCLFSLIQNPPDVNQNIEDGPIWSSGYKFGSITPLGSDSKLNSSDRRRHSLEAISGVVSLNAELRAVESQSNFSSLNMGGGDTATNSGVPTPMVTSSPQKLIREKTWDIEPKNSLSRPPSTSPIPVICTSFEQISLGTQKETDIVKVLLESKRNIERALQMLPNSNNLSTTRTYSTNKKIPILRQQSVKKPNANRRLINPPVKKNPHTPRADVSNNKNAIQASKNSFTAPSKLKTKNELQRPQFPVLNRPGSASKVSQRPTVTPKRRLSPGPRTVPSSSASSTHSGSTGNLSSLDSTRRAFSFMSSLRQSMNSKIPSPNFGRRFCN